MVGRVRNLPVPALGPRARTYPQGMNAATKAKTSAVILALLGVAMIIIGALGPMAPPILTGIGFGVLAWALWPGSAKV